VRTSEDAHNRRDDGEDVAGNENEGGIHVCNPKAERVDRSGVVSDCH